MTANIAAGLPAMALERPNALAVLAPCGRDRSGRTRHVHWTFRQLDRESDRVASALMRRGIGRGVRTVLMVRPSLDFFALTFGLFKAGAVPVLVDPGLGMKNLGPAIAQAEPEAFVGIPAAQLARKVLGWGKASIRKSVTIRPGRLSVAESRPVMAEVEPDEIAAILFTSGSTGVPKGAVYSHAIFQAQVRLLRDTYDIRPGEVDLCTFPLFALFGPILGMSCVVPEMDATRPAKVNPSRIFDAIEDFGVTNLFGSPALIRRVGDAAAKQGRSFPTLRRVISAGAPVPARVLETFAGLLAKDVQIFTPYGATESLPVCSIGSDEILRETRDQTDLGAGVCVGRPVEGMRVEIIKIDDGPIEIWSDDLILTDGEIGEIAVQGPVVTRSYFRFPKATTLAKIDDPATGGLWHRMGDVGYRDSRGRIWFCGRKSHRVKTSSGDLFTIPCEGVFNAHPQVFRSALVGVGEPGPARPILCVELTPGRTGLRAGFFGSTRRKTTGKEARSIGKIRAELLEMGRSNPKTRMIDTILFHPSFPVDIRHNAKIFREKLAVWASKELR